MPPRPNPTTLAPILLLLCAILTSISCNKDQSDQSPREKTSLVLYSSVDDYALRQVTNAFEQSTGIRVDIIGDTEATKTTGLVQRLLAEKNNPRADVWWSSEPFGTIKLAQANLFSPYTPQDPTIANDWPPELIGKENLWHGLALRSRVIAYASDRITKDQVPRTLQSLLDKKWKGKVALADPRFGTTRGHMSALVQSWGQEHFQSWLSALRDNDLRIYTSNSAVVRAIAKGEVDIALTDTDDVFSAQRIGYHIAIAPWPSKTTSAPWPGIPMTIPNTIALIRNSPNPTLAKRFIDFVLSEQSERILAQSDSRNMPVRPSARAQLAPTLGWSLPTQSDNNDNPIANSYYDIAAQDAIAVEITTNVLHR